MVGFEMFDIRNMGGVSRIRSDSSLAISRHKLPHTNQVNEKDNADDSRS